MEKLDEQTKGCVYFFKHLGLSPVKIGYSSSPSPIKRFDTFRTYAPFGAELVGFIQTAQAKELESRLHSKFETNRLEGEWFDLDMETINNTIKHYSTISQNEERNQFMIAYAKSQKEKEDEQQIVNDIAEVSGLNKSKAFIALRELLKDNHDLNKSKTARTLKVSRRTVYNWVKIINDSTK